MFLKLFLLLSLSWSALAQTDLLVGIGSTDATPEVGTPLGGYGGSGRRLKYFLDWGNRYPLATYLRPSNGVLDPIRAKSMVVQNHQRKILFVSLDVVGITIDVYQSLQKRLKHFKFDEIILTATHTHSGPGALTRSFLWQVMAMDKFEREIYEAFIDSIVLSVELAHNSRVPATLHQTKFQVPEIHRNRRGRPGHMDSEARVLLAKNAEGEIIGGMVNFAIHGCALGESNLLFSADVSGGIERHMEKLIAGNQKIWPTILFVNGAEGDVSNSHGGRDGIELTGDIFAQKARPALAALKKVDPVITYSRIDTQLDRARINLKKCEASKKEIKIPVSNKMLPRLAGLWQVKLGDILIMTFPGEATTDIGFSAKALARQYQEHNPWIFGLANGHMGYFVTPEEFAEGGYETCVAFHGPNAGAKILEAHKELLRSKQESK
jgi:neutral ceramidase